MSYELSVVTSGSDEEVHSSELVNRCVRWASEPVESQRCPGFDGLGGPSYELFPMNSQALTAHGSLLIAHSS